MASPPVGVNSASLPQGYAGTDIGDPDDVVDHRIEVALGKGVRVHDVTFYISAGDGAVPIVLDVCRSPGITPFDTETGEVLTALSRPPVDEPVDAGADEDRPWWRPFWSR